MDILQAIKETPEWVALLVALGGLGWQQKQIWHLQHEQKSEHQSRVEFLEKRMDRMFDSLENVRRALMLKTVDGVDPE